MTERPAARVLVLDQHGRVLLLHGRDADRPGSSAWWFTPGGGVDEGETPREAAARELFEETGIRAEPDELGPVVHERSFELDFQGAHYLQREVFFSLRVHARPASSTGWTEVERRVLVGAEWLSTGELVAGGEPFFPENLVELVEAVAAG